MFIQCGGGQVNPKVKVRPFVDTSQVEAIEIIEVKDGLDHEIAVGFACKSGLKYPYEKVVGMKNAFDIVETLVRLINSNAETEKGGVYVNAQQEGDTVRDWSGE